MPLPDHRGHLPKRRYQPSPVDCEAGRAAGCGTWCCRIPLVQVAAEDLQDGLETEPGFVDLLRRNDQGACAYLDEDDRCTVWERRPLDCRIFSCEGRNSPAVLRPCEHDHGPVEPPGVVSLDETDCAHCGERAGFTIHFLGSAWRIRCVSCGGPYLPRVVRGMRPRLRVDPGHRSDARGLADRARTREYLGDPAAALDDFAAAATAAPEHVDFWLATLHVAVRVGDDVAISRAFDRARGLDEARAWLGLGLANDALERWSTSRPALLRAEALGSKNVGLFWALGRAARADGRLDAAAARLEVAAATGDVRVLQDLVDLATEGVPGAVEAIRRVGDRRARAAIGLDRPWLSES